MKKKNKDITKYIDFLNYIIKKISPNLDKDGRDLHADNIYLGAELVQKFGWTEKYIRNKIMAEDLQQLKPYLEMINDIREDKLINNTLLRRYDSSFSKFILINRWKEDYKDKQTIDSTTNINFDNFSVRDLIDLERKDIDDSDDE